MYADPVITLNTDRGLIRLEEFNDIFEMPGFTVDVDPNESKLESIIGNYQEKDLVRCGLSSCHTKHGKGYLVKVEDGTVTNIGKGCGKTHFGVDFESMSRQMDRDIDFKERRENLKAFRSLIPDYKKMLMTYTLRNPVLTGFTATSRSSRHRVRMFLIPLSRSLAKCDQPETQS